MLNIIPSDAKLKYLWKKTRILRFKGLFDRKSLSNKGPATCVRNKVHNMSVSYVTHSTKRVKK